MRRACTCVTWILQLSTSGRPRASGLEQTPVSSPDVPGQGGPSALEPSLPASGAGLCYRAVAILCGCPCAPVSAQRRCAVPWGLSLDASKHQGKAGATYSSGGVTELRTKWKDQSRSVRGLSPAAVRHQEPADTPGRGEGSPVLAGFSLRVSRG